MIDITGCLCWQCYSYRVYYVLIHLIWRDELHKTTIIWLRLFHLHQDEHDSFRISLHENCMTVIFVDKSLITRYNTGW